jgi:hypothetical protein
MGIVKMVDDRKRPLYVAVMGGTKNGCNKLHHGCPIHRSLVAAALSAVTDPNGKGYFRKDDLLRKLVLITDDSNRENDFSHMGDSIHWDYIIRFLKEEEEIELIPLAECFFSKLAKDMAKASKAGNGSEVSKLAGRALASGHGKKTAGYAAFRMENAALVIARIDRTRATLGGVAESLNQKETAARDRNIPISNGPQPIQLT